MSYKVKIKLEDGSVKEFTFGSDIDLPDGLKLNASQIQLLLSTLESIATLMGNEKWQGVQITEA